MDKVICIVENLGGHGFDLGKEYLVDSKFRVCNNIGISYVFSNNPDDYNYIWKRFLLKSQFREDKIDGILS